MIYYFKDANFANNYDYNFVIFVSYIDLVFSIKDLQELYQGGIVMELKKIRSKSRSRIKDHSYEKIKIDDYLDLNTITDLQKFQVGYSKVVKRSWFGEDKYGSPKVFNVMAIEYIEYKNKEWLFLCDSKNRLYHIVEEFMESYDYEEPVPVNVFEDDFSVEEKKKEVSGHKRHNAKLFFKEAVKVTDARREFLKFLLYVGGKVRGAGKGKVEVTGCQFDLPDFDFSNGDVNGGSCIIIDKSDFDTLFEEIFRWLPQNKTVTRIEIEYGEKFAKKEEVLESYRRSVHTKDLSSEKRKIQAEIKHCAELIEKEMIEKDFGETYIAILSEKIKILETQSYMEARKIGKVGEKEVEYALKWLDKSYMIVPKMLSKRYEGEKTIELCNPEYIDEPQEYDHIVIGKQGVFVIETKYYSGKLVIDSNGNWIREKKDGTRIGERNPYQQIDRHVKLLKSFLKEEIPVNGLICMAHPEAIIEGAENSPVKLVKSDLLTKYIEDYKNNKLLSAEEITECFSLIDAHRYR